MKAVAKEVTEVKVENVFPLRISKGDYLTCPYELSDNDNLILRILDGGRLGHIELSSIVPSGSKFESFKRHLLYSKTRQGGRVATYSGYPKLEGGVQVYAWVARDPNYELSEDEKRIVLDLARVSMDHVKGDEENKTAGLDRALLKHRERIRLMSLEHLTLEELENFHSLLTGNVPKY